MANYRITEVDDLTSGGAKTKARQNIAAIKLLKEIETAQRTETVEEQAILVRYSGWGTAPDIFTAKSAWATLKGELEELLTEEEFAAAKASTINAFYTDTAIAAEIYKGVEQLGFAGGNILDPSLGATGIFEGTMPAEMANSSEIVGVELDELSGRIASQLYPDATVHIRGFQDTILADDHFDLTISNVPFSEVGVSDPRYKRQPVNTLHDYFFAKGLDKLRPGGLLVYITSTGTMQSAKGKPFRQYMSERANLVGAMRLPGDAFKKNAGTEVTTDLIILQKLGDGIEPNGITWTELAETDVLDTEGKPLRTNEYYARQPELMLGQLSDDKLYPGRLALKGDGRDLTTGIRGAFATMPSGIYQPQLGLVAERTQRTLVPPELQSKVKQNGFTVHEDKLMQRKGDYLEPSELTGRPYERVIELLDVRDAVQAVFDVQLQQGSDVELSEAQNELGEIYDSFVKKNGYIHQRGNKFSFREDPDYPLLLALENYDQQEKTAKKTDIFFKRTIQTYEPKTHADSAKEGLLFSLNELGRVDIGHIAKLTSQSRLEVIRDLQEEQLIFRDPVLEEWQTNDEYLSGNVKQKLKVAQTEVDKNKDSEYEINVEALQAVQPEPLLPGDIDVRLGSVWVPPSDVEDFTHHLLGIDKGVSIEHSKLANTWYVRTTSSVNGLAANNSIHGTGDVSATTLISQTLNLRNPTVYKPHPTEPDRRVIDQDETAAARLKQEEIKGRFKDWIWQDPERTDRLTKVYNDTFNTNRERVYDGSHLELPGKNPNFVLRQHQANAVYRSLSGNTLFAHAVGAGKTAAAICAAMEQKRLGFADKPMFVVPNHLLEQWAGDIKHLYPTANVLAATKEDAKKSNRQELMARIATGQWDAVVVTHSAFGKLKLSEQSQTIFLSEEYAKVEEAILSIDNGNDESRRVMKDLEKKKTQLKEKIGAIANSTEKDETITFEQLGVDLLVVDESHYFKNLGYVTKMRNIAGLPNTESQRAFDMHMKVRQVGTVRGEGKGSIFLTGTPITNSMAELYTLQRYLQPEELKRTGLESFDDWASVFGEMVSSAELSAAGKFQVKSRFASFVNMPELMGSVRQVMDVQTADMLNLPVPKLLNGKPTIRAVPATSDQLDYMDDMVRRVNNMSNVDPTEDNMLKITGDGKAVSVDTRLRIHRAEDDPNSKINRFVDDAYDFWETHRNEKTHLAFCDLGTPKPAGQFSLYQDIKNKLVAKGVPEHEIAFAQSYKSDAKKLQLQKDFNKGKIPLLISGAQLETGFNGQQRLARISHLTVPWRPDQIEQRDGRMIRQGNRNETVESIRYVTQGRNQQPGMDGYFWQTLEKKAGFISQVMKGDTTIRRMSDVSEEALDFATAKAIATGNPLIMEMATLDNTIRQLSGQKRSHTNAQFQVRRELDALPKKIERIEQSIRNTEIDLSSANSAQKANKITLFGQQLSLNQIEEIGKRIISAARTIEPRQGDISVSKEIGQLGSFKIHLSRFMKDSPVMSITGESAYSYDKISGSKLRAYEPIRSILNTDIAEKLEQLNKQLSDAQRNANDLSQHIGQPFSKEEELAVAVKRLAEVHKELNAEAETQKEKSGDSELSTDGSASEGSPDNRPRVAPKEKQESTLAGHVAIFLETVGLQHKIVSTEGFYLTLKHQKRDADLTIDTDDGKRVKLVTNIKTGRLPAVDVTAVFQLDRSGILTLESIKGGEDNKSSEIVLAVKLGRYLSANRTQFVSPLQATDTVEANKSTRGPKAHQQTQQRTGASNQRQENSSTPGPSVEGLASDIAGSTRPRVAPHNEQRSGISERITKFLEAVNLQHKAAATEGLLLTFRHEEQGTDLIIEANGGERIKLNTSVQISQSPAQDVSAVFQLDQDGILALESIETAEESTVGKPALAARLAHYLSVNKEKFVPLAQTINAVENSQSTLETKADEVPSQEVRSLETDEDQPATQRRSRTEPVNAKSEPQPLRQRQRAFGVSEEVTLRIRSLHSGKETEVTLPSDIAAKPAVSSDNTKDTLQTETTARSHDQTKTEDARAVMTEDDPRKDTDSTAAQPLESGEAEPREVSSTDELSVFQGKHIAVAKNLERKGLEVRFTQKPAQKWTKQLKSQKFKFSKSDNDPRWWRKLSTVSIPWAQKFAEGYEAAQVEAAGALPTDTVADRDTPEEAAQAQPEEATAAVNTNVGTEQPITAPPPQQVNSNQPESAPAQPTARAAAVNNQQAAKDTQEKGSRPRPGFKRYLSCKEQHPQAVAMIRHPHGYYETYQDDAAVVADTLNIQLATADSGYAKHGKVDISRVFQGQIEPLTTKLQEAHSVAIVDAQDKLTVYPQQEIVTEEVQTIQPAIQHQKRAERNVAKLIHNADLATQIMSGEEFSLKVENGALTPLKIESHYAGDGERLLYLTHYAEQPSRDVPGKVHKMLSSETVFVISASGMLKLEETAVENPTGSGELRQRKGGDRTFAGSFTRNLLRQEYDKAAASQKNLANKEPDQRQPNSPAQPQQAHIETTPKSLAEPDSEIPQQETNVARSVQSDGEALPRDDRTLDEHEFDNLSTGYLQQNDTIKPAGSIDHDKGLSQETQLGIPLQSATDAQPDSIAQPEKPSQTENANISGDVETIAASAFIQQAIERNAPTLAAELALPEAKEVTVKVDQLRQWYMSARAQQKGDTVLDGIKVKGITAKDTGAAKLNALEVQTMNMDLEWLAQHPLAEKPIPINTLREWHRANTLLSGASHKARIEEIAQSFQMKDVDKIYLERPDYQQMARDVRSLRSALSSDLSDIWNAVKTLNILKKDEAGCHYAGERYKISYIRQGDLINISTLNGNREVSMRESSKAIVTNTFAINDVKELHEITKSMKETVSKPVKQMQQ